ncbi:ParA family protein [Bacillaceae bacterium]
MDFYYSWQDVALAFKKRKLNGEWPEDWYNVEVFHDEIEIEVLGEWNDHTEEKTFETLVKWFGLRIDLEAKAFRLESFKNEKRNLSISVVPSEAKEKKEKRKAPLFRSLYDIGQWISPPAFSEKPKVFAFHSYKGGVGRTLSVLSFCRSLSKIKREEGNPLRLLIIDADFEAPGLTWLARENKETAGGFAEFSLLDALTLIHEEERWEESVLNFIASKVKEERLRLPVNGLYAEHFFLPAHRSDEQLLSMPVEPEDLVQFRGREWIIGDFVHRLGERLGVDAVVIDLRAGISEFSAPILLDPRIQNIFVSTTSFQSLHGTSFLLHQIMKTVPGSKEEVKEPLIFLTMVTKEAKEQVEKFQEEVLPIYMKDDDDLLETTDRIKLLPFAEELVHLEGLESIDQKLSGTSFEKVIDQAVAEMMPTPVRDKRSTRQKKPKEQFLRELHTLCKKMEYAETDESAHFLKTIPIRNLAQKFATSLPSAVVMGAKGSGKTFIYLQLVKKRTWGAFLETVLGPNEERVDARIIPLISSRNLEDRNKEWVKACLAESQADYNMERPFQPASLLDDIESLEVQGVVSEFEWRDFWLSAMGKAVGYEAEADLWKIDQHLKAKGKRVTFVVDGLEDIFTKITESEPQQKAVRALCQGIVSLIREIPDSNIGLIVFVRKDIVQHAITQNFGQFSRLYDPFELRWNQEEALRLALWVCQMVDPHWPIEGEANTIEHLQRELIEKSLIPLWGLKLGKEDSKEAITANWVVLALSDFRGQLQARDMVRFLGQASILNQTASSKYHDRYLQPNAIRQAIDYCSSEKVREIAQEIPVLEHIFNKIKNSDEDKRELPFERETLHLTVEEIKILETHGIVFKQDEGYYMPEIFRRGLHLKLKNRAKPKVIYLMKNALRKSGN